MENLIRNLYAKYAPDKDVEEQIKYVQENYGNDMQSFVTNFYSKYAPENLTQDTINHINKNYIQQEQQPLDVNVNAVIEKKDPDRYDVDESIIQAGFLVMDWFSKGKEFVQKTAKEVELSTTVTPGVMGVPQFSWRDISPEERKQIANQVDIENLQSYFTNAPLATPSLSKIPPSFLYEKVKKENQEKLTQYDQDILADLNDGKFAQAGSRIINAAIQTSPTLLAAYLGPGALSIMGVGTAGELFEQEVEEDPERALGKILVNVGGRSLIEVGGEVVTRKLLFTSGLMAKNGAKKAAEQMFKSGVSRLAEVASKGLKEGSTEYAQFIASSAWDEFTSNDYNIDGFNLLETMREGADDFIVGTFIGSKTTAAQNISDIITDNSAVKSRVEYLLTPDVDKNKIIDLGKNINNLQRQKKGANVDEKAIIDKKLNADIKELNNIQQSVRDVIKVLKQDEIIQYGVNLDKLNKLSKSNKPAVIDEIKNIKKQNSIIFNNANKRRLEENLKVTRKTAKKIGLQVNTITKAEDFQSKYDATGQPSMNVKDVDGFIVGDQIYINKQEAEKVGAVSVGSHELLHGILKNTINDVDGNLTKEGENLINAFRKQLNKKEADIVNQRIDANYRFNNDGTEKAYTEYAEEYLNVYSDAILKNDIKYSDGLVSSLFRIGSYIANLFKTKGYSSIEFKSGKDVYDFLRTYNEDIQKGEIRQELIDVAKKGAKISIPKIKLSQTASDNVQRIYEQQGFQGAFEIISEFKPIVNKIVEARSQAPNFDRELLTTEIEVGTRGIIDLIREYKPESGVPLAAYINKFLPARAIEASRRVLGEEFTTDITEARGVAVEEVAAPEVTTKPKARKINPIDLVTDPSLKQKYIDDVVSKLQDLDPAKLTFKKLKDLSADNTAKIFDVPVKKVTDPTANLTKQEKENALRFIRSNALDLISLLPKGAITEAASEKLLGTSTGVPKSLLNNFYTKQERITKGAGLSPYTKNRNISKADFLKAFGIVEGKKSTDFGPRTPEAQAVKAMMSLYGKLATNSIVRDQLRKQGELKSVIEDIAAGKSILQFSKSVNIQVREYSDRTRARNEFQVIEGKKVSKTDPELKNKVKEEIIPYLKKLSKETRVLMLYTMQGTGKDKIDGTLGRSGMIFPNKGEAMVALGITQKDINSVDIKDAQNYAGKPVLSTSKLPINLIKNLLTDTKLHKTIARENLAKETKLKQIVIELAQLAAQNPDIASGLNHIIGLQSDYQGHFIRKLVTFQSFTDPKLLGKGIHDEHYSKSLRTTRFVQSIIDKAASEGDVYLNQEINDDLEDLVQGQARGIVSKIEGNKFDEKKGIGEQTHIAQTPFEEVYKRVQNPKKHYILPYTRLNPTSEIKTLQEVADNNFKIVKNFKYPSQLGKLSRSSKPARILNDLNNYDKALRNARNLKAPVKGISIFDFDDTLATTKSKIIINMPDGKVKKITPAEFAKLHSKLEEQGATFDFSEFSEVIDGKPGPLAAKLKKAIDKFGNKDVFVLTARPQASAQAIYEFLKGIGLEIPLKNITGLENGTPQAKANWVVDKASQGYNDFYFTDDAYKNVKAVQDALEVLDVKSKSRIAYVDRVAKLDKDFNDIIEAKTGIASEKEYSIAKAKAVGSSKGKFTFFIPPSAEDFVGLLYPTLAKGKLGDNQMAWYKKNLLDPFARANANISRERITLMNDYKALKKQLKIVPKNLRKNIEGEPYTNEQAVRVYIWNKQGMTIPGLSKTDLKELTDYIESKPDLKIFGDQLISIQKGDEYNKPNSGWLAGSITTDIQAGLGGTKRAKHLAEWQQNADIIFSEKNLNKMEAAFGKAHRVALEGVLKRMKTGVNRSFQTDNLTGKFTDWLTNSIGTIMFFNTRSALLQTISAVNFINFKDNNIFAASKAYANQPQFWSDFMKLMNSDFLVDRRRGLRINVNEADIANMARESGVRGAISKLLEIGFLPTQIADSFAIASGGATFYRNRIKTYEKQGLSKTEAESKAMDDFREIAEESQQSSRPDRISAQQAGPLGRIILAFGNTPMQYARLIKKAASDLKNRRGDWKTNTSKIIYYGVVQNLIFNALQQAIFAIAFGESDEDKEEEKYFSIANGMADSLLRGIGIAGAFVSVGKNAIIRIINESEKPNPKYEKVGYELTRISPPISSKLSKLNQAARSLQWEKDEMLQKGLSYENPAWLAGANVISATTNIPLDRLVKKTTNVVDATGQDVEMWERLALLGGWAKWELDMTDDRKKKKPEKKIRLY